MSKSCCSRSLLRLLSWAESSELLTTGAGLSLGASMTSASLFFFTLSFLGFFLLSAGFSTGEVSVCSFWGGRETLASTWDCFTLYSVVPSPVDAAIAAAAASRFCLLRSFLGAAGFLSSTAELSTFISVLGASGLFSISWLTGSSSF